jgi:hypothetical protein
VANPLRERYAEVLLDRIRSDEHPSGTQMDMFESFAPPELLVEYIVHLMEIIERDEYPSVPMMQRVQRLVAQFGA